MVQYYLELEFAGASLQTSEGQSFTKVVAPFKVADNPKPGSLCPRHNNFRK